jgi:hypothetical protein
MRNFSLNLALADPFAGLLSINELLECILAVYKVTRFAVLIVFLDLHLRAVMLLLRNIQTVDRFAQLALVLF